MITFENVRKRFGERLALDDVSWHMDEGECVVILGDNGAGKTTLVRLITHEVQPDAGSVTVGTFRGGRLSRAHRALLRRTVGIIYEDFRLLNDRTVFENVALAVRIMGMFPNPEVIPRVLYALQEVGLQHKQTALPQELSAGERQRVAIARAIVNRPAAIIADEPTGALEPRSAGEILALLRRVHHEGAALLLVTTKKEVARAIGGRLIVLRDGRVEPAPPDALASPAPPAVAGVGGATVGVARATSPAGGLPPPPPGPGGVT
jgi:cell division transport system ATP-binding protein